MIRIYIAGSSAEIERCERFRDACRAMGFEVTFDWMAERRRHPGNDRQLSNSQREWIANKCFDGVHSSHVIVLLFPRKETKGAWLEFGYALGCEQQGWRIVVGDDRSTALTARYGITHIDDDAEALEFLRGLLAPRERGMG